MESMFILVPISIILAFIIGWFFWWSGKNGQFDDLEGPAHRILMDDDSTEKLIEKDENKESMSLKKDNLNFHTTRRFAPLFGTQFLGALNDNMFKTALFVMISFYGLGKNDFLPPSQMLNLGAMLFILPYFLFSALSGQLSNKFDKAVLARWIKLLEIIIMAVAAYGFYIQSAPLLLICLFCMGTQSTLFGPLKYAILPDSLNDKELIWATA